MQSKYQATVSQSESHKFNDLNEGQMHIYRHLSAASELKTHLAEVALRRQIC